MSNQPENPKRALPVWWNGMTAAQHAPRCGANTRGGGTCKAGAMPNGRCRMHGGGSTGPRTPEGLERLRAARTTHGNRTAQARELRAMIRDLKAQTKRLIELA
jgi:hypothetical protein